VTDNPVHTGFFPDIRNGPVGGLILLYSWKTTGIGKKKGKNHWLLWIRKPWKTGLDQRVDFCVLYRDKLEDFCFDTC
jgi:hypothetical protein